MPSSAVSQFPTRTPSRLTPFTRRMLASRSGLRSPQSDASYASRRIAANLRLIVDGAARTSGPYRRDSLLGARRGPHHGRNRVVSTPHSNSTRTPGGQSRWSQGKDLSWEPLRHELVVEVAYDHMQGDRFRHTAQFRRWRTDKKPNDCTYAQLEVVAPQELAAIFPQGR